MSGELPDALHKQITMLAEQGDEFVDAERYDDAMMCFQQAWLLLPEPRDQWEAATWILTAMGDTLFLQERYSEALAPLQEAVGCPDGLVNPFIHLRLGQVQFEMGNVARAKDELARAFMGGGDQIFGSDDPKYWRFIREILRPGRDEVEE